MQESTFNIIVLTLTSTCAILLLVLSGAVLIEINALKYQGKATQAILATNTLQHELFFNLCELINNDHEKK
jgi:hypothetical protein